MDVIERVSMNLRMKDVSLVVSKVKGRICLCFMHKESGEQMIIHEFFGQAQYERWLCEAVLLRCAADKDKKSLSRVREWHSSIVRFLDEKVKRHDEIIH